MTQYDAQQPRDFLAVATPGAGKTTFALTVAADLLNRRVVERITVVAPTEHLKQQWAEAAERVGIPLDPTYAAGKGKTSADYVGIAVTYAGVGVNPLAMRIRTERFKTLVILDEIHHAGDALSWGEGVREAFEPAQRRLALTGTPFRSDVNPIPFVTYAPGDDGIPRSAADYTYGYAEALADHVVRPVLFMAYSGELTWRTRAGDEVAARLGEPLTKDMHAQALRTALDPQGAWIPAVLAAADTRLSEVRTARARRRRAGDRLRPGLGARLRRAAQEADQGVADGRAVGRDRVRRRRSPTSPRATSGGWSRCGWSPRASTCHGWRSVSGRRPRARRSSSPRPSAASSGPAPAARPRRSSCRRSRRCSGYAAELEVVRDHVLGRRINDEGDIFAAENDLLAQAQAGEGALEEGLPFEALNSEARFDHVLFDGSAFGHEGEVHAGSDEEMDFLGIPGLLEPGQMRELLQQRQAEPAAYGGAPAGHRPGADHPRGAGDAARESTAGRRVATGAQRPGRRLAPPHRPGARRHPRRAAARVRRPRRRRRQRHPAARPDRPGPRVGGDPQELMNRWLSPEAR